MTIRIDAEFQSLIPPLQPSELEGLESSIREHGCRDPLVIWRDHGILLDGHNRHAICSRHGIGFNTVEMPFASRSDAMLWVIDNQFGRRNLPDYVRGVLSLKRESIFRAKAKANKVEAGKVTGRGKVLEILPKPLPQSVNTREELAKSAGISGRTLDKVKKLAEKAPAEVKEKLERNEVSINRAFKDLKESEDRQAREEKRVEALAKVERVDSRILVGDFREVGRDIADGSVSLMFTDPPYDRKASRMLPDLGAFAASKLADGGSLILYVGQTQIPDALDALRPHLRYWWTICCLHGGGASVMREYGINANWKAVLWFVKGTRHDNSVMVSDVMSGGREKSHHAWQQAQSEAEYWIEKLTPSDGLVCDPFFGGGTTGAAAKKLGRPWIGIELDEAQAVIASERVA